MNESVGKKTYEEKKANVKNGCVMLLVFFLLMAGSVLLAVFGFIRIYHGADALGIIMSIVGCLLFVVSPVILCGLKIVRPQEAAVLVLFGRYYGTIKDEGFFWVNPFCTSVNPTRTYAYITTSAGTTNPVPRESKKISLKVMTLNNEKQTVNDELGNPIIIGTIVIWRVVNTAKAVFNVDNYKTFLSIQCDSATRNVTRLYPYDVTDGSDEKTLRGSSQEISNVMKEDLQKRVKDAGIEVQEVRITHLSYAPEIAAAMLQRQQAEAVIAARQKIVEGAVSMVEMALQHLNENNVVALDEERKAAMVSNLLVVLCGNRDVQPVVNSGSIY